MAASSPLILCYHKVDPAAPEGEGLNVDPKALAAQIGFLKRRGYRFEQARNFVWPGTRTVYLTFDDAYVSAMTHGLEVLRALGVTATFYAVSRLVGKTSEWDGAAARPIADWDLMRLAHSQGFEIGNHTATHLHLGELAAAEQRAQVDEAKEALREFGEDVSFCYPYGSLNRESPSVLREAGFRVGMSLRSPKARVEDRDLCLPRIEIGSGGGLPLFVYKIWVRPRLRQRPRLDFTVDSR